MRGRGSAAQLAKTGLALAFVAEAFKHGKPLAFVGDGAQLIVAAHLPVDDSGAAAQGVVVAQGGVEGAKALVEALKQHRFHNRDIDAVAA